MERIDSAVCSIGKIWQSTCLFYRCKYWCKETVKEINFVIKIWNGRSCLSSLHSLWHKRGYFYFSSEICQILCKFRSANFDKTVPLPTAIQNFSLSQVDPNSSRLKTQKDIVLLMLFGQFRKQCECELTIW